MTTWMLHTPDGRGRILSGRGLRTESPNQAKKHFAYVAPCQQKRFSREHFTFARQQKRFSREHFTFARQQKRFPRCRRTGVVFRRSVHPPADPAWPSARVRPPGHSKSNNFFKNFHERCIFRPLSPVLWVEESFFSLGERLVGSSRGA